MTASPVKATNPQSSHDRRLNNPFIWRRRREDVLPKSRSAPVLGRSNVKMFDYARIHECRQPSHDFFSHTFRFRQLARDETQTSSVLEGKVRNSSPRLPLFRQSNKAFTLLEMFIVISVIAFLALLILPSLANQHHKAPRINCMNNLKQVGLAFRMWNEDNGAYPMQFKTSPLTGQVTQSNRRCMFIFKPCRMN